MTPLNDHDDTVNAEYRFYVYDDTNEEGYPYYSVWVVFAKETSMDVDGEIPIFQYTPTDTVVWNSFMSDWGTVEYEEPSDMFWTVVYDIQYGDWYTQEQWDELAEYEQMFVNEIFGETAPWATGEENVSVEIEWLFDKTREKYEGD